MNRHFVTIASVIAVGLVLAPARSQRDTSLAREFLKEKDRWAVKTGADPAARYLRVNVTQPTRVKKLIPIERPAELPMKSPGALLTQTNRYSDTENKVFSIDADIIRYRLDPDDRDLHLVLRDHDDTSAENAAPDSGERRTMIAKIPDPTVVSTSSPWRSAIARVRKDFEQRFHPGTVFTERVIHARVIGVGFFDYQHGQNGSALNGLELHPVLDVQLIEDAPLGVAAPALTETAPIKPHISLSRPVVKPLKSHAATTVTAVKSLKAHVAIHKSATAIATSPVTARRPAALSHAGKVWINLSTGTYWRPGSRFYGKTKRGRYMSEKEAIKIGFVPAAAPR